MFLNYINVYFGCCFMILLTRKKSYSNGLFIPLHRVLVGSVLESAIIEAQVAKSDFGIDLPIIIIDDAKNDYVSKGNYDLIKKYQEKLLEVEILWISKGYQRYLVKELSINLDIDPDLLESKNVNYGVVFNTLFIVGKVLGVSTYHRRDSDVTIQRVDGEIYAPIYFELKNIAGVEKIAKISDSLNSEKSLNIVGGNYLDAEGEESDSSLRLDACMKNEKFITAFLRCIPADDVEVVAELRRLLKNISDPSASTKRDLMATVPARNADAGYVDCGNVCFTSDVYGLIPSAPNDNLIGADYHFFNIARILDVGFLSHQCAVLHDKIEMRSDEIQKLTYWRNMFYFCDAEAFHFEAYALFMQRYKAGMFKASPSAIRQEFVNALKAAKQRASQAQRLARLNELSEALCQTGEESYRKIAEKERRDGFKSILLKGLKDLDDYISLLQRWQDILDYLPQLNNAQRHGV